MLYASQYLPIYVYLRMYVCMYVSLMFSYREGKKIEYKKKLVHQNQKRANAKQRTKKCD